MTLTLVYDLMILLGAGLFAALLLVMLPGMIVLKALAAAVVLRLTGLPVRSSLGMGIGLAHVGEFAFVVVLLGVESGILTEADYQHVVALAVCSLIATPLLSKVGLRWTCTDSLKEPSYRPQQLLESDERQAVVIGAGPIGRSMASQLETLGNDVCLVDLSPLNLHSFAQEGFRTVSGDATDGAILARAGVNAAALIVVCVPDDGTAQLIVRAVRRRNPRGRVIVRCRYQGNIRKLSRAGASDVVAEESEAALALLRLVTPASPRK